jgi:hypothetical protein
MQRSITLALIVLAIGCSSPEVAAFDAEHPWRQPGDVIDSILPMEEHERRFREGLTAVTALSGGSTSRDALAERFLEALEQRDSLTLHGLMVSRAEFAWLVFPAHLYRQPPYELDPGTLWMQLQQGSAKGLARALERHGGQPLEVRRMECQRDTLQLVSELMTMWGDCQLSYQAGDSTLTRRLFGSMVELDGVVKFLSYSNDF